MGIKTVPPLTGPALKTLRLRLGLNQTMFWAPACVSKGRAIVFEKGERPLPGDVSRLMWLHYYAQIPVDASPEELVEWGKAIGALRKLKEASALSESVKAGLISAVSAMGV